jgi:hypothetical protein
MLVPIEPTVSERPGIAFSSDDSVEVRLDCEEDDVDDEEDEAEDDDAAAGDAAVLLAPLLCCRPCSNWYAMVEAETAAMLMG